MTRHLKAICFTALCAASVSAYAQPGITAIAFTGTSTGTESWATIPSPGLWNVRAILTDSAHHAIGSLSPTTTLNTASAPSYPTGFNVTLGQAAPADAIVLVYRSPAAFGALDAVDKAEYTGLCAPSGCPAGVLTAPATGDLLNTQFTQDATALPVKLQDFSVD